ncbi:MAG: hypothetical protein ACLR5G_09455 [Eubacteriales bacterium]
MKSEKCPVCGSRRSSADSVRCGVCGFGLAFAGLFADMESLDDYKKRLAEAREKYLSEYCPVREFAISSDAVDVVGRSGKLLFWDDVSGIREKDGVAGISICGEDVIVIGEDRNVLPFGQGVNNQHAAKLPPMRCAAARDGRAVYVDLSGKLHVSGPDYINHEITRQDIIKAVPGEGFILVLYEDGRAETIIGPGCRALFRTGTRDGIADIAAGGCAVFLGRDGKVIVDGVAEGDVRLSAQEWSEIKSVAADSGFVYGVDRKGKVYSAGKCPRGFDRGRSDVSQWTDTMAITCGRSCVAALIKNGEVRYAGIFTPRFADILPDFSGRLRRMMKD